MTFIYQWQYKLNIELEYAINREEKANVACRNDKLRANDIYLWNLWCDFIMESPYELFTMNLINKIHSYRKSLDEIFQFV